VRSRALVSHECRKNSNDLVVPINGDTTNVTPYISLELVIMISQATPDRLDESGERARTRTYRQQQRRHPVAQRLAAASGHQHERILA